jgi:hypothetical protein
MLRVQNVTEYGLGWCSIFCLLKEKKKGRNGPWFCFVLFSPGQTCPVRCAALEFVWLLGALKGFVWVSSWILCAPNVLVVIVLARSNQNYPSVAPMSQGGFWSHGAQEFWFPALTTIFHHPQSGLKSTMVIHFWS